MTPSMPMSHPATAAGVAAAVQDRLDALVETVVARIRGEIPFYTQNAVTPDDLRESGRAFQVVAAETEPGRDPVPRAESALAVVDVRSVWRLDADLSVGVLPLADRRGTPRCWNGTRRGVTGELGRRVADRALLLHLWPE